MKALTLILLTLLPLAAISQPKMDPSAFRQYLAAKFVKEFVQDFNSYSAQDVKDIYQFFLRRDDRASFFRNFRIKPIARGNGNILYLESPRGGSIKIEIVDLLKQQYKINGKKFAFDLKGDLWIQLHTIEGKFRPEQARNEFDPNRIFDWLEPRADAQIPQVFEDAPRAVETCVEGGCQAVATAFEDTARFITDNSKLIKAGFSEAGQAAAKDAATATKDAEQVMNKFTMNALQDPQVKAWLDSVKSAMKAGKSNTLKALKNPPALVLKAIVKSGSAGLKALTWLLGHIGNSALGTFTGVGPLVLSIWLNSYVTDASAKVGIPTETGLKCLLHGHAIDNSCPYVTPQIPTISGVPPGQSLPFCPSPSVNEIQTYEQQPDGTQVGIVITTDAQKGVAISALRFEIKNGAVDTSTVRSYDIKNNAIDQITQPAFQSGTTSLPSSKMLTMQNQFSGANAAKQEDTDMENQVVGRQNFLAAVEDTSKNMVIYDGDLIADHNTNPTGTQTAQLNQEYTWAKQVMDADKFAFAYCSALASTQKPTGSPPPPTTGTGATPAVQ